MKLVDLIPSNLFELEFKTQKAFLAYRNTHDLRPNTKVTVAGKTQTVAQHTQGLPKVVRRDQNVFNTKQTSTNKGAGSGSQSFKPTGKEVKLKDLKPEMPVRVKVYYNKGAGSGSQGWYDVEGFVKKVDGDKLRIIDKMQPVGSNKSISINTSDITKIHDLSGTK